MADSSNAALGKLALIIAAKLVLLAGILLVLGQLV